jgi:hypothetical protein
MPPPCDPPDTAGNLKPFCPFTTDFRGDGAEVVSAGEADVCVEGGGEAAQEGDGGLGAGFLDALDVVVGQGGADGQFGDGQAVGRTSGSSSKPYSSRVDPFTDGEIYFPGLTFGLDGATPSTAATPAAGRSSGRRGRDPAQRGEAEADGRSHRTLRMMILIFPG